jgi:hypothetical protein
MGSALVAGTEFLDKILSRYDGLTFQAQAPGAGLGMT